MSVMKSVTITTKTEKGCKALAQALDEDKKEILGVRLLFNRMYKKEVVSKAPLIIKIIGKAPAVRVFVTDDDFKYKIEDIMLKNNGSLINLDYSLEFEK